MHKFIIKEDLLIALNAYLREQPFKEVERLIVALRQLELAEKKDLEKERKK